MAIIQRLRRDRFRDRDLYDPQIKMVAAGAYNEVQHGRYLRFFQKFLGMKGREPSEVTLAAEIMPQLSLFHGQENRYLEAWSKFAQGATNAAVAAQFGVAQLRNPSGSNVVLSVEQIYFAMEGTSSDVRITTGPTTTDVGGVGVALASMDSRDGPRNSTALASFGNQAGQLLLGNSVWRLFGNANTVITLLQYEDQAIPVLPGQAIAFSSATVNIATNVTFQWRERFLEDSERA